jgi:plasmid stabilization system protein ParE
VNYSVTWLPDAENELAAIWVAAGDRNAITRASAELDRLLSENGPEEGESRPGSTRVTFVRPLAVLFRVDLATRTVAVARVWEFRWRSRRGLYVLRV